jgi:predicted RNase H-like nuclease (RuvC/YqgF family)
MSKLADVEICRLQEEVHCLRAEIERLTKWAEQLGRELVDEHDDNERLTALLTEKREAVTHWKTQLNEALVTIERLQAALKPFAAIREIDDARFDDNQPVMPALNASWVWCKEDCQLTLGDFRQAREALNAVRSEMARTEDRRS